jgi:hypothetical protein
MRACDSRFGLKITFGGSGGEHGERVDIPCSEWARVPSYTLPTPWWHTPQPDDPAVRDYLVNSTPAPFARRKIFCGNRLFQNKYEMYEWTQEARAKGITDPGEIWTYARDKEISVHGA